MLNKSYSCEICFSEWPSNVWEMWFQNYSVFNQNKYMYVIAVLRQRKIFKSGASDSTILHMANFNKTFQKGS